MHQQSGGHHLLCTLTARERHVLQRIASGDSCVQAATNLGIRTFTIRKHRSNILSKLGLHSTAQLVAFAVAAFPEALDVSVKQDRLALSRRERQIVSLIAEGLTSKQVARRIGISPATVRKHRENVAKKLGASGLAALVHGATATQGELTMPAKNTSSEVFPPNGSARRLFGHKA